MSLSQTATVLIALFTFCLVAVTAQLAYVLWWKRRFRRRSITGSEFDAFSTTATPPPPSKELLYFFLFCLENKHFRIESATAPPLPPPRNDVESKWSMNGGNNLLCGPSETLFTISEDCTSEIDHRKGNTKPRGSISTDDQFEQRRSTPTDDQTNPRGSISTDGQTDPPRGSILTDDPVELSGSIATDHQTETHGSISTDDHTEPSRGRILTDDQIEQRWSILMDDRTEPRGSISTDGYVKEDEVDEEIVVTDISDDEVEFSDYNYERTTPFSTPCASPPFYTPSPSPVRDDRSKMT